MKSFFYRHYKMLHCFWFICNISETAMERNVYYVILVLIFQVVPDAGHSMGEVGIAEELVKISDNSV